MALIPEVAARGPEQAMISRGVEVTPVLPTFDGANVIEVQDAFIGNLNLVSGGVATAVDGRAIQTDGILGSAKIKIGSRLEEITQTGEALAQDRGEFSRGRFRGPRAVREIEQEQRRTSQADNRVLTESRKQVKAQQERIRKHCKEHHITGDLLTTYDNMIAVEEYLTNNGSSDLEPIRSTLEALKWTRRAPTRERIEDLLDGARTLAQGYEGYKALKIGRGENESRVKGLRDFEADFQQANNQRTAHNADVGGRLEAARAKAKDWESRYAQLRTQDTPDQRRLKNSYDLISRTESFLGAHYTPDVDKLTQVGADLTEARGNLASVKDHLANIARIVGSKAAKFVSGEAYRKTGGELEKKIADLEKEQQELVDPSKRLTQDGAPKELKAMVRKVQTKGFDLNRIPSKERVLAEAAIALLGKVVVKVEPQAAEEPVVAAGDVPEVSGPAEEEWSLGVEDGDDAAYAGFIVGAGVTESDVAAINEAFNTGDANKLADLAMRGVLTASQLFALPTNPDAAQINETLISPEYFDTLEADLRTSLKASESGRSGISKDDLSNLIVDALRRVAPYLVVLSKGPEELVNVDDLRAAIDQSLNDDRILPETVENMKRLLTVVETAYRVRNS